MSSRSWMGETGDVTGQGHPCVSRSCPLDLDGHRTGNCLLGPGQMPALPPEQPAARGAPAVPVSRSHKHWVPGRDTGCQPSSPPHLPRMAREPSDRLGEPTPRQAGGRGAFQRRADEQAEQRSLLVSSRGSHVPPRGWRNVCDFLLGTPRPSGHRDVHTNVDVTIDTARAGSLVRGP